MNLEKQSTNLQMTLREVNRVGEGQKNVPKLRFKGYEDAWEQRKLGDVTTFNKGKGYSKKDLVDNGTPIILYGRLYTDYQTLITKVDTFVAEVENSVISEGWEVIVPASGESAEDISRASVVAESGIILGGDLNIINKCSLLNPVFLALTISNGNQQKEMSKRAQGKSVVHLHNSDLKEINLVFPEIKEQSLIGEYFEKIDKLITLHQRKYDALKVMKKTLLSKMFPKDGETTPEIQFSKFEEDWGKIEFGNLLNEKREKTIIENEDTLLSCAIEGIYLNSELFNHFRGTSTIGYIKVKKDDLILSTQNLHLGNCNVNRRFEHGIISPAYKVYELVNCDPLFIQAWVKQDKTKDFFLRASTEGASLCRKNIVWEELYRQEVSVPNIEVQKLIGDFFDKLDKVINLHQRKLEELKNMKRTLLQQMFV